MIVPGDVVNAVRRHAIAVDAARPGFESLGVLVCDGDHVVRYSKLANPARRPFEARVAAPHRLTCRGRQLVVVHAHPTGPAAPSETDLAGARRHDWQVFGIYSLPADELRLWRIDGDDCREVEWSVASGREEVSTGRARLLASDAFPASARRGMFNRSGQRLDSTEVAGRIGYVPSALGGRGGGVVADPEGLVQRRTS